MTDKDQEIIRLKKQIERLKNSVKKQRYGLVWMNVPEAFEDDVENKMPILKEVTELAIKNDDKKPCHILIEGDNYHALTCLNYTHKGKIDVIYIDPPYNTGSDGFRYKDKRIIDKFPDGAEVPKEHPFRHSYWLSFIQKRLELAKDLLKEDGVIFISIDDNEFCQLKLLCDEIFGEENVELMIWEKVTSNEGKLKIVKRFRRDNEYILVVYKNINKTIFSKVLELPQIKNLTNNADNDPRGDWISGNLSTTEEKSNTKSENYYTVVSPTGKKFTRQWKFPKEEFDKLNRDNRISWGNGENVPRHKIFVNEAKPIYISSIIKDKGTAKSASAELEEIFGEKLFDNPKPTTLLNYLFSFKGKDNLKILDFFAGSGTTAHSVLKLNEDGKNFQLILVTNNENNIMTEVCYPRIKKLINGYKNNKGKQIKGIGNSLKYYKTEFIGKNNILNVTDSDKVELAHNAGELLAIAENTLELIKQNKYYQLFEDNLNEKYTAVYFREELDQFDKFIEMVEKLNKKTTVYVFSWGNEEFISEFENIKNIKVKTIPLPILEIYKNIYNL